MTEAQIREFGDAWDRGDLATLMSFVAEDCVYSASVGPEPGATFVGREAVRSGFLRLLALDRGGKPLPGETQVFGDRAIVTWGFSRTDADGIERTVRGCDIFRFRDGLIVRKDAYRKVLDQGAE